MAMHNGSIMTFNTLIRIADNPPRADKSAPTDDRISVFICFIAFRGEVGQTHERVRICHPSPPWGAINRAPTHAALQRIPSSQAIWVMMKLCSLYIVYPSRSVHGKESPGANTRCCKNVKLVSTCTLDLGIDDLPHHLFQPVFPKSHFTIHQQIRFTRCRNIAMIL